MKDDANPADRATLAEGIAKSVSESEWTVAVAESVTGGHIATALAAAESSADWFRGGVVAYGTPVKQSLLGVDPGPVMNARTARQMAKGVRRLIGADFAVATTGVGGPDPTEGVEPGTVFIGVTGPRRTAVQRYRFGGDPAEVVDLATRQALQDLLAAIRASELTSAAAGGWSGDSDTEDRR